MTILDKLQIISEEKAAIQAAVDDFLGTLHRLESDLDIVSLGNEFIGYSESISEILNALGESVKTKAEYLDAVLALVNAEKDTGLSAGMSKQSGISEGLESALEDF